MFKRLLTHHFSRQHIYYDRETYENILKDPNSKVGQRINQLIHFCVFLAVGLIIFETVGDMHQKFFLQFFFLDAFVSIVFAGEYIYRFFRSKNRTFFMSRPLNIIDFLSFAPFFLSLIFSAFWSLDIFKVLRLFRTLRLFEVSSKSPIALGFIRTLKEYGKEYKAVYSIFITILIVISTFVYYFEFPVNSEFSSIPDALWWGIVTMTTVGYGDIYPITLGWKIFWSILIILWPALLAVISSITILVFMDVAESHRLWIFKTCWKCRTLNQDDANYCKNCGNKHFLSSGEMEKSDISFIKRIFKRHKNN